MIYVVHAVLFASPAAQPADGDADPWRTEILQRWQDIGIDTAVWFRYREIRPDTALGQMYFPAYGLDATLPTIMSRWYEHAAHRDADVRMDFRGEAPEGFDNFELAVRSTRNGEAWTFHPDRTVATRSKGDPDESKLRLDTYGGVVGMQRPTLSINRGVPGELFGKEPFDLVEVAESHLYRTVGSERVGGQDCVVVERPGMDKLWLGRNQGHMVVKRRWHWTPGGPVKRVIVNDDFRDVGQGRWLPFKGQMDVYGHPDTKPGVVCAVVTYEVEQASADPPPETFVVDLPPHTLVRDRVEWSNYFTGDPTLGEPARIKEDELADFDRVWELPPWLTLSRLLTGVAVLAVAGAAVLAWRQRQAG